MSICTPPLLHVPHHGARTTRTGVLPGGGCAGGDGLGGGANDYGHPVPATLEAVADTGAPIWRTDQHGTITGHVRRSGDPVIASER